LAEAEGAKGTKKGLAAKGRKERKEKAKKNLTQRRKDAKIKFKAKPSRAA
jgi:hypothetical protein